MTYSPQAVAQQQHQQCHDNVLGKLKVTIAQVHCVLYVHTYIDMYVCVCVCCCLQQ